MSFTSCYVCGYVLTEAKDLSGADALTKAAAEWSRIKNTEAGAEYHQDAKRCAVPDTNTLAEDQVPQYLNQLIQKINKLVTIALKFSLPI